MSSPVPTEAMASASAPAGRRHRGTTPAGPGSGAGSRPGGGRDVLPGAAAGGVLGLLVGSVLGLSTWTDALLSPLIGTIRAVPSLAWVPLLILWMGINEDSKGTLIAVGAFFPIFTNLYAALKHVDPHLVEAGRAFGFHGLRLLRTVQLPAVVPSVFSGLRLALAQAWLILVAAELIVSSMGLSATS